MTAAEIKRLAGRRAVDELVTNGMKIGLGTGSTAIEAVRRMAELVRQSVLQDILVVPTSFQTEVDCRRMGLSLWSLNDPVINGRLDLTIDGADEVDPDWNLIKGGGGAMLIEKIIAHASDTYCIVADESKIVNRLGEKTPVPVEIVPEALLTVSNSLEALGSSVDLRMARMKDGPVITDHGNFILDISFKETFDPRSLETEIKAIPGVMASGIFTRKVTDLFIGMENGKIDHRKR